jgi:AraC-like DNA-binding protein
MLALVEPSALLLPYVDGYVLARDLSGKHSGRPIRTVPRPGGVLTVNLGRPNRRADGSATPILSLLGIQTSSRVWYSDEGTYLVMALLTPAGVARLAQTTGGETANALFDLGSLIGDRAASDLRSSVSSSRRGPVCALDDWLLDRLFDVRQVPELRLAHAACDILSKVCRVDVAAKRLGVSRRQLCRVVSRHLGVSPKALMDLYRLERSVRALQSGRNRTAEGYADQAHQIREWRRRLGTTPGRYSREGCSVFAEMVKDTQSRVAFYL